MIEPEGISEVPENITLLLNSDISKLLVEIREEYVFNVGLSRVSGAGALLKILDEYGASKTKSV